MESSASGIAQGVFRVMELFGILIIGILNEAICNFKGTSQVALVVKIHLSMRKHRRPGFDHRLEIPEGKWQPANVLAPWRILDREGAWRATSHRVSKTQTQLKQLKQVTLARTWSFLIVQ